VATPTTTDPVAAASLRRAIVATKAVRSYRFSAEQRVSGGPTPQITRLTGRVIRPSSLTYSLVTAGQTQQVVRLGSVTYRRVLPGPYKRVLKAARIVDPLGSVTGILTRLAGVTSAPASGGTDYTGSLSGQDAAAAGLVGNAAPGAGLAVPVQVRVDGRGRVIRLELTAPLQSGTNRLMLQQITTYAGFDAQPAIARPR